MTIKKRLVISNILMVTIPIITSVVTVVALVYVLNVISGGAVWGVLQERFELITQSEQTMQNRDSSRITAVMVFLIISFIAVIYFTGRLLSRLLIKRIETPLLILADGVHQISEGNLDAKIIYTKNDEFKPVCEAFNDMAYRLKTSIEEVQKSEQNRKELLTSISHDLRSPLTSVKAFVEGLIDGVANTPEAQAEYLQIIKQKTDEINNMVSQLFYYSKMDMGNYPTHPEEIGIANEIRDFINASYEDYKAKGLLVKFDGEPCDGSVFADPLQLRSVFSNILENSVKYKNKETAQSLVSCTVNEGIVRIAFEDDGMGVSPDDLVKLFDVFFRADTSRSNPKQGSGLGLAIVAKALERMNGRIHAENVITGGLRMVIEIPEKG